VALLTHYSIADLNSLLIGFLQHLVQTYFLPKCPQQVQSRAAFLLSELSTHFGITRLKTLDQEDKLQLQDLVLDLFQTTQGGGGSMPGIRTTLMLYGVQLASEISN
jgi:hypothetical protein